MKIALAGIVAGALALTACTASHSLPPQNSTTSVSSTAATAASRGNGPPITAVTTTYGQDAALIAGHVPGCTPTAKGIGNGALTGLVAEATCTVDGHLVDISTWKDANSQFGTSAVFETTVKFWAAGNGWTAVLADQGPPDAQKAVAQIFATALGGQVEY